MEDQVLRKFSLIGAVADVRRSTPLMASASASSIGQLLTFHACFWPR